MLNIPVVTSIGKIFSNLTQVSRTDLLNAAAYPCCTLKAREKNGPKKFVFFMPGLISRTPLVEGFANILVGDNSWNGCVDILEVTLLPSVSNENLIVNLVLVSQPVFCWECATAAWME